jgi:hypothetical protein
MFYRFVHEWSREEAESPYSSGIHSLESSPTLQSSYPLTGDTVGDVFGHGVREHAHYSSSPLSRDSALAPHLPDGPLHREQE